MMNTFKKYILKYSKAYLRNWWGVWAVNFSLFGAIYITIWAIIEPLSIPDNISIGDYIVDRRWMHILLSLFLAAYGSLLVITIAKRFVSEGEEKHQSSQPTEPTRADISTLVDNNTQQIHKKQIPSISIQRGTNEVFEEGVKVLQDERYSWNYIRVYAPVGFWAKNDYKTKWIQALADMVKSKKDGLYLRGVFGLPPSREDVSKHVNNDSEPPDPLREQLTHIKNMLKKFENLDEAVLHYIPPTKVSSGQGAIFFEGPINKIVVLGYATRDSHWVVDTSISFPVNDDVYDIYKKWFDDQIFSEATKKYILQDRDNKINDIWDKQIRQLYKELKMDWQSWDGIK